MLRWEMQYTNLPVRWLTGKNLHVTLIPPWHTEDDTETRELLADASGTPATIPLAFNRVAFGPDPASPRLIWAEGETPSELVTLRDRIAETLTIAPERKLFRLHLTLARFREEAFGSFPIRKLNERVDWKDVARSFVLMESHLSPRGADYEILATFPLGHV